MTLTRVRKQRSVLAVLFGSVAWSYLFIPFWLERTARELDEEHHAQLPSPWTRAFGLRWLRAWAHGISRATRGRISPRGVLVRLALFPIGVPLIQHHLNATRVVLPAARLLPARTAGHR